MAVDKVLFDLLYKKEVLLAYVVRRLQGGTKQLTRSQVK